MTCLPQLHGVSISVICPGIVGLGLSVQPVSQLAHTMCVLWQPAWYASCLEVCSEGGATVLCSAPVNGGPG